MKKKFYCSAFTKNGKNCKNCVRKPTVENKTCKVHAFHTQNQNENENEQGQNRETTNVLLKSPLNNKIKKKTAAMRAKEKKSDDSRLVLAHTEEIYGIITLNILYSREYNQTILLLGELHHISGITECDMKKQPSSNRTSIQNYIEAIIQWKPEVYFFDFYLERHLVIENKKLQPVSQVASVNINEIRSLFSGCLEEIEGKKCKFSNLRVHAADARFLDPQKAELYLEFIYLLLEDLEKQLSDFDNYIGIKPFKFIDKNKVFENLYHPVTKPKNGQYNIHEIQEFFHIDEKSYVMKEIRLIDEKKFNHNKNIKNLLLKELEDVRTNLISWYIHEAEEVFNKVEKIYKNNNPPFIEDHYLDFTKLYDELSDLEDRLLDITFRVQDLYTLARIFHKFTPKPGAQPKINFTKYPTNIIYYAGATHTDYTLKVLTKLGYKEIYASGSYTPEIYENPSYSQESKDRACIPAPSLEILEKILISSFN